MRGIHTSPGLTGSFFGKYLYLFDGPIYQFRTFDFFIGDRQRSIFLDHRTFFYIF